VCVCVYVCVGVCYVSMCVTVNVCKEEAPQQSLYVCLTRNKKKCGPWSRGGKCCSFSIEKTAQLTHGHC